MKPLTIDPFVPEVIGAIERTGRVVLTAPPGTGKTTRIPPALVETGEGTVLLVEPRRLAAHTAAARIAEERGTALGEQVGYQVRFEKRAGASTRLLAVTEGILLRRLQSDPFLDGVSTVILDEFHERSVQADLLLGLLREVSRDARRDLQILVMSATLEVDPVRRYLDPCEVVTVPDEPHRVEVLHVERGTRDPIPTQVSDALNTEWPDTDGHALVFLPGWREIRRCQELLHDFAERQGAEVHVLHGSLGLDQQRAVLRPGTRRKIVLATNVAESSLTIDGVHLVIDSGLERRMVRDHERGLDRLRTERISRQSAEQRAGRAGRQGPGRAVRLWTRAEHGSLHEARPAEITRVDLAPVLLELAAWGTSDPAQFEFLDAPPDHALEGARRLLQQLNALDQRGQPTEIGRRMMDLPTHPRLARLILAGVDGGFVDDAVTAAALLEERDILPRSTVATAAASSDLLARIDVLRAGSSGRGSRSRNVDGSAVRAVERVRKDLLRRARSLADDRATRSTDHPAAARTKASPARSTSSRHVDPELREQALLEALTLAFPDRIARRRPGAPDRARMVGGHGLVLSRDSAVRDGDLFVVLQTGPELATDPDTLVIQASLTRREWLQRLFPANTLEHRRTFLDDERDRIRTTVTLQYGDLALEEPRDCALDVDRGWPILIATIEERLDTLLREDERCRALQRRLQLLIQHDAIHADALDREALAASLASHTGDRMDLGRLRRNDLASLLSQSLSHDVRRALAKLAPDTLEVPSGSQIRLQYQDDGPPILAVRLQEMFGLADTPRIAGGRVPVLLHLLGPNHRPVQVTQDLANFWNETYHQVRKDLRGRYPKHSWPENPWTATAVRGTGRRRS